MCDGLISICEWSLQFATNAQKIASRKAAVVMRPASTYLRGNKVTKFGGR